MCVGVAPGGLPALGKLGRPPSLETSAAQTGLDLVSLLNHSEAQFFLFNFIFIRLFNRVLMDHFPSDGAML